MNKLKLAIIGSRSFNLYDTLCDRVQYYFPPSDRLIIISGGASGADRLAAKYAKSFNIELIEFLPDWQKYGKSAGFKRNKDIVNAADVILAFWDGISKGTKHSLDLARELKKDTIIIYF